MWQTKFGVAWCHTGGIAKVAYTGLDISYRDWGGGGVGGGGGGGETATFKMCLFMMATLYEHELQISGMQSNYFFLMIVFISKEYRLLNKIIIICVCNIYENATVTSPWIRV
jgi:hypothetical protein